MSVKTTVYGGAGRLNRELERTSCTEVPSDDIKRDFPLRSAERRVLAYLRIIFTVWILTIF